MRKSILIAKSNIRRAKGQTAAIIVLILIAALMLNLWLMLSTDYTANFDRYHDKLNAEHVTLTVDDEDGEVYKFLTETLDNDDRVSEYRVDECLAMQGTISYNSGKMSLWCVFLEKELALTRSIGKVEIVEEGNFSSGAYVPMIYKSDDIAVGKPIEISVGTHKVEYTVCGFFNSIMMGSNNCTLTEFILTDDKLAELESLGYARQSTLCSVRLHDKSANLVFEADIKAKISEKFPDNLMTSNSYDIVLQARYISQMITSGIVVAMAFFILLIALVVIASNIINFIQVSIKNLGALKSVGYTSRQLVCSMLLQFLAITLIATFVGIALSYALFPAVNSMMIAQTGIPYAIRFLPLPALISILILGGTVALVTWLASRRIKKIEPIVALRSGVQTHNFKRNHVPLEKTKAPLNFALALKTTLSNVKHNITVCITMLVLSLIVVFSGLMLENAIVDFTPFCELVVGETNVDSCISVDAKIEDEFLQVTDADNRVEKVYLYHSEPVSHYGGIELTAIICDDFSKINNQRTVFEGRFPKYDNEIALAARYAKDKGFKIGSEIEITVNGRVEKYLICGFTQISNNLGRDCMMTREGYEKLGTFSNMNYYLVLTGGTDIDAFNEEMQEKFPDDIYATLNYDELIKGASSVYISLITIIVIAILILSAIIIAFVLYLLVRTMLNNKKRDYGILKSLGFTTKQLILQTALSFMPAIILSTVIGLIVSSLVINPLMSLFLSGIGVVKCTFALPIGFIVGAGFGLILFAFAFACLMSLKIKKIAPRNLLVGE